MADLSPAAQAVLEACWKARDAALDEEDMLGLAAALEALADQVAPEDYSCYENDRAHDFGMETRNEAIREQILAIAAELRGSAQ